MTGVAVLCHFPDPGPPRSPGMFVEMLIVQLHPRPTEAEFLGLGPGSLHLIQSHR